MDIMDMNSLSSFVEDMETYCEEIQDRISFDEDDPIDNEIITCISRTERAIFELDRYLTGLAIRKYLPNFPLDG